MTEAKWLICAHPHKMLWFLRGRTSSRKWRLYLCGGCRRIAHLFFRPWSLRAVEVAERFADGKATREELHRAEYDAEAASFGYELNNGHYSHDHPFRKEVAPRLVEMGALPESALSGGEWALDEVTERSLRGAATLAECCAFVDPASSYTWWHNHLSSVDWPGRWLVDCVFGNPFRSVAMAPAWLTWHDGTVPRMAQAMYDDRAFDRLRILADALEEAGCTNADILNHCRQPGEHVRGCWVIDLLLDKN
jgi:hypothetical protein